VSDVLLLKSRRIVVWNGSVGVASWRRSACVALRRWRWWRSRRRKWR
jgi:hypothetical protein